MYHVQHVVSGQHFIQFQLNYQKTGLVQDAKFFHCCSAVAPFCGLPPVFYFEFLSLLWYGNCRNNKYFGNTVSMATFFCHSKTFACWNGTRIRRRCRLISHLHRSRYTTLLVGEGVTRCGTSTTDLALRVIQNHRRGRQTFFTKPVKSSIITRRQIIAEAFIKFLLGRRIGFSQQPAISRCPL